MMSRDYSDQEKKYVYNSLPEEYRELWCKKMNFDAKDFNLARFDGVDDANVDWEMVRDAYNDFKSAMKTDESDDAYETEAELFWLYINTYYRDRPRPEKDFVCPVCGKARYHEFKGEAFCPVCGWQEDKIQLLDHDYAGGANALSVNELKKLYEEKMAKEAER